MDTPTAASPYPERFDYAQSAAEEYANTRGQDRSEGMVLDTDEPSCAQKVASLCYNLAIAPADQIDVYGKSIAANDLDSEDVAREGLIEAIAAVALAPLQNPHLPPADAATEALARVEKMGEYWTGEETDQTIVAIVQHKAFAALPYEQRHEHLENLLGHMDADYEAPIIKAGMDSSYDALASLCPTSTNIEGVAGNLIVWLDQASMIDPGEQKTIVQDHTLADWGTTYFGLMMENKNFQALPASTRLDMIERIDIEDTDSVFAATVDLAIERLDRIVYPDNDQPEAPKALGQLGLWGKVRRGWKKLTGGAPDGPSLH